MKTPGEYVADKRGSMISPGIPAVNKPGPPGGIIWGPMHGLFACLGVCWPIIGIGAGPGLRDPFKKQSLRQSE